MEKNGQLIQELLQPGEEYTPIPFWFFNDTFDEERIKAQLKDYVEKGVNGFVLHPRIGVPQEMPYLSEEFFRAVRFIVETADSLHMKVVLYDEGMYPSGSAHGMVVEADPEYASKGIILLEETAAQEKLSREKSAKVIATLSDGRSIVYGFTGGTIRGIHFGEDDREPGAPKSADILNPDAVDEFIRLTHDRYYQELQQYFGNTVIAFFTDEPCSLGRNAGAYREWAPGLEEELLAAGGRLEELEGLFTKKENATTALYRRLIKRRLRETFYARLSKWCESHSISLMGHPAESDDIEEELYFHIPGQDLILRRISPETGGLREPDSMHAKLSADIARHLGSRRNANECFGVCYRHNIPWYFTSGDMKWYIDWMGLRGVNLFVPHAFYYSVEGDRKGERPPDVGPNNIWWSHYRRFSDYMKRLSWLNTDSQNGARVAVLCDNNRVPCEEVACLYENQVEFNYLPAALAEAAQVCDGRLCIQGYAYEKVLNLLGEEYQTRFGDKLGSLLVQSAEELVAEKLSTGGQPEKVSAAEGLAAQYRSVMLSKPCPTLRAIRLTKQGVVMYLFGNEGNDVLDVEVSLCGFSDGVKQDGMAVQASADASMLAVDLWRGSCLKVRGTAERFRLHLEPSETLVVLPDIAPQVAGELQIPLCEVQNWEDCPDWTSRFTAEGGEENVYEYHYRFQAQTVTGQECFAVKGDEMIECFCNGSFVDVSFFGETESDRMNVKHHFCVGPYLRQGENEIRLRCTGNAANIYENADIPYGLSTGFLSQEEIEELDNLL